MKRRFVVWIMWMVVMNVVAGCASKSGNAPEVAGDEGEVRIYQVFGMNCPGCHGGVENLVLKIPAVLRAQASWKEQRLVVVVKPGSSLDDELVYDAIRRANFTPGERIQ